MKGRRGPPGPRPPTFRRTELPLPGKGRYLPGRCATGLHLPRKRHFWGGRGGLRGRRAGQDAALRVSRVQLNTALCAYLCLGIEICNVSGWRLRAAPALLARLAPRAPRLCAPALQPPPSHSLVLLDSPQPMGTRLVGSPHLRSPRSKNRGTKEVSFVPSFPPPSLSPRHRYREQTDCGGRARAPVPRPTPISSPWVAPCSPWAGSGVFGRNNNS